MEKNTILRPGVIVQLNPNKVGNKMFACCFMVISELKDFGAQGYVQALGTNGEMGGQAYYRANFDEMEFVGIAKWVVGLTEYDREDNQK